MKRDAGKPSEGFHILLPLPFQNTQKNEGKDVILPDTGLKRGMKDRAKGREARGAPPHQDPRLQAFLHLLSDL